MTGIEIKDLLGLSDPLVRLVEVIANGIGKVSTPYLTKMQAKADDERIKLIASSIDAVGSKLSVPVVYRDDGIEIWKRPEDGTLVLTKESLSERQESRESYQARKRQDNVENVTTRAAIELSHETEVPETRPDEDWVSRFFSYAEDITSEQMQQVWGRILAGEIKSPGSYSLRALDAVRNLSQFDAEILEKLAAIALRSSPSESFVFANAVWMQTREIPYGWILLLIDAGLIHPTHLTKTMFSNPHQTTEWFTSGDLILLMEREAGIPEFSLEAWRFTSVGNELLKLIECPGDRDALEAIGRHASGFNCALKIGEVTKIDGEMVSFKNAVVFRPN